VKAAFADTFYWIALTVPAEEKHERANQFTNRIVAMQTMRREGLTDVLTNDRHFEQEGFRALFRL
jgi:predicted nucleic acid-binding protein